MVKKMLYKGKEYKYKEMYNKFCDKTLSYSTISKRLSNLDRKRDGLAKDYEIYECFKCKGINDGKSVNDGKGAIDYKGVIYTRANFLSKFLPKMSLNAFVYKNVTCGMKPQDIIDGKKGKRKPRLDKGLGSIITAKLFPPTSASFKKSYKKSWRLR